MAITNNPFGELTGRASVERFLLERQERQMMWTVREHMGDGWYLPHFPADKPARPKSEKPAEPVNQDAKDDAKPQNKAES